jgi:hypothetical protein
MYPEQSVEEIWSRIALFQSRDVLEKCRSPTARTGHFLCPMMPLRRCEATEFQNSKASTMAWGECRPSARLLAGSRYKA